MVDSLRMEPAGKRGAQRRADRIRAFREELRALRGEGGLELTAEQEARLEAHLERTLAALAARYDIDVTDSEKRIAWGMRIASTVAGLALCAAVVLFFYRIWGGLATPAQVAVLVSAPLLLIAAMEWTARRERTFYYTGLLGIVAFASAVLNLSALGGMFNLGGSPYAFAVWAVFGLALGYAYRLRLLAAAGLVCAILFAAMTILSWSGLYWAALDNRPETLMVAGAVAAAAPAFLRGSEDFAWVYRMIGLFAVFVAILAVSLNGTLTFLPVDKRNVEILYQVAGLAAAALAMGWGGVRAIPGVVNLAAGFFALYLYIRLYRWWWDWMPKYLFFLIIALISLALLYGFQRLRKRVKGGAA